MAAFTISMVQFHAGHYDEAIAACRRTMEFDPRSSGSYHVMLRSYAMKGMYLEAMAAHAQLEKVSGQSNPLWRAYILARSGDRAAALEELRKWDVSHPKAGYQFPYALAQLECGETDRGFEMLSTPSPGSVGVKIWSKQSPELRKWHGDPRFRAVVEAVDRRPVY